MVRIYSNGSNLSLVQHLMILFKWVFLISCNNKIDGKKPALMDDYYEGDKCDVDYEILGLLNISMNWLNDVMISYCNY